MILGFSPYKTRVYAESCIDVTRCASRFSEAESGRRNLLVQYDSLCGADACCASLPALRPSPVARSTPLLDLPDRLTADNCILACTGATDCSPRDGTLHCGHSRRPIAPTCRLSSRLHSSPSSFDTSRWGHNKASLRKDSFCSDFRKSNRHYMRRLNTTCLLRIRS